MKRIFSHRRLLYGAMLAALSGCAHVSAPTNFTAPQPLQAEELLAIASAAEQTGDGLRAQQYLLAALNAGISRERALPRLLRSYVADGQYRLAIDVARDFLRAKPDDVDLHLLLARLYEATELEAGAVEEYERIIAAAPSDARAHFALASLLHEHGSEPGRADEHFRAYLALAPRGEDARAARAALLKELP